MYRTINSTMTSIEVFPLVDLQSTPSLRECQQCLPTSLTYDVLDRNPKGAVPPMTKQESAPGADAGGTPPSTAQGDGQISRSMILDVDVDSDDLRRPAARAPSTALIPTPPHPNTPTVSPGRTFAALHTAPTPVVTAQPTIDATSNGVSAGIFTAEATGTRPRHGAIHQNVNASGLSLLAEPMPRS